MILYYGTNAVNGWNPFADDTDNNGNVRRAVNYVPTVVDGNGNITSSVVPSLQDYSYDELNRIGNVSEAQQDASGAWTYNVAGQTFGYDRYGNRQITATQGGVNGYNPSYTASNNRINGLTYDAVGNITYDGTRAMTYDANNKMVTATMTGGVASYRYDAAGQRTLKTVNGVTTWMIYGMSGELIAEYPAQGAPSTPQIEYGYRGGELLIEGGCDAVRWRVTDHLGSTRMSIGATGSLASVKRTDYLPFGEELGAGVGIRSAAYGYAADCWRQKFTGYERDVEIGLDYAQARYYANVQGRFISPDPLYIEMWRLADPQQFNLYSYVRGNPLKYIDPTGLAHTDANGNWVGDNNGEVDEIGLYWLESGRIWVTRKEWLNEAAKKLAQQTADAWVPGGGIVKFGGTAVRTEVGRRVTSGLRNILSNITTRLGTASRRAARIRQLGTDPARGFIQEEAEAASRLLDRVPTLRRYADEAYDWIDDFGKTYDAVGPLPNWIHFNHTSFVNAIERHFLRQGLDYIVVDIHGLGRVEAEGVILWIRSLPPEKLARIITQGH